MLWDEAALVIFTALALGAAFGAVPLTGVLLARPRAGGSEPEQADAVSNGRPGGDVIPFPPLARAGERENEAARRSAPQLKASVARG